MTTIDQQARVVAELLGAGHLMGAVQPDDTYLSGTRSVHMKWKGNPAALVEWAAHLGVEVVTVQHAGMPEVTHGFTADVDGVRIVGSTVVSTAVRPLAAVR